MLACMCHADTSQHDTTLTDTLHVDTDRSVRHASCGMRHVLTMWSVLHVDTWPTCRETCCKVSLARLRETCYLDLCRRHATGHGLWLDERRGECIPRLRFGRNKLPARDNRKAWTTRRDNHSTLCVHYV